MFLETQNTTQLLSLITKADLYVELIQQLNKDFTLSNIDVTLTEEIVPSDLKNQLYVIMSGLIQNNFDFFLNLLYRIDLSEYNVRKASNQEFEKYVEMVVFLILKRECQKIWLKRKYS